MDNTDNDKKRLTFILFVRSIQYSLYNMKMESDVMVSA